AVHGRGCLPAPCRSGEVLYARISEADPRKSCDDELPDSDCSRRGDEPTQRVQPRDADPRTEIRKQDVRDTKLSRRTALVCVLQYSRTDAASRCGRTSIRGYRRLVAP